MGRHNPLTTPGHSISGEQAPGVEPSLSPSAVSRVTRIKEKKGPMVLEAFLSLALLPLSLYVNLLFPFVYKRESRMPQEGDGGSLLYTAIDIKTHALTCLRSTRTSETWDMSLSRSFITPTTNFQC